METLSVWHWLLVLIVLGLIFLPAIFYILSFRKTAMIVNGQGGQAPFDSAWFLLVPLFNYVWFFILILQLKEAISRIRSGVSQSWWTTGVISGSLSVASIVLALLAQTAVLSSLVSLVAGVLFIVHWVQLVSVRRVLLQH